MDLLKWYKNIFESNELDPPGKTWDRIQDQLDIDNSWQVIDRSLKERSRATLRLRIAAAASLLVLVAAGASWIYLASVSNVKQAEQLAEDIVTKLSTGKAEEPAGDMIRGESTGKKEDVATGHSSPTGEGQKEVIPEQEKETTLTLLVENTPSYTGHSDLPAEQNEVSGVEEAPVMKETPTKKSARGAGSLTLYTLEDKFEEIIPSGEVIRAATEKTRKAFRKFYLGTTGQLANTWLVNQKTISGFKSASLVSTNATFGSNIGFFAGTELMNKLDLQADFNILAQNNQDYNEYIDGNYVSNKLKLDYSQLALSLRYNMISKRILEGEHGINFGGYLAYLHNAYQNIDGEKIYLSDNYSNMDYGLLVGYEYVFPLSGHLGLGTGFRAYYGLSNIYAGGDDIPSYMNVTNNASVNITLSFRYLIR
jgi:hypothetical protein